MSSTLSSPPAAAAAHDDASPSDTPTLAAHQPGPVISEPSSTATDRPTSDLSPSPSDEPSRVESGADDPTSVIDAASLQLPSNHAGKTKEEEEREDKLDRFSCHIWCARPFESAIGSGNLTLRQTSASKCQTNQSSAHAVTCTAGPVCTRCALLNDRTRRFPDETS